MTTKIIALVLAIVLATISYGQKTMVSSQYFTDSIFSKSLNETRKMNIYLPSGYSKGREYPIIYATDGSKINMDKLQFSTKTQFDSLIENKIIRPTIVIEEHCNTAKTNTFMTFGNGDTSYTTFRTFEYVENWAQPTIDTLLKSRFKNHMNFFVFEMIPYVESKFCNKVKSANRYFYGFSNGAGFGVNLMNKHPEIIGTYICYSTAGSGIDDGENSLIWENKVQYPKIYFQVGNERDFTAESKAMKVKFKENKISHEFTIYEGGHDYKIWSREFEKRISLLLK